MPIADSDPSEPVPRGRRPVAAAVIRTKITDLDGSVTTRQLIEHLRSNGASEDELASVADLPEREWADYNDALAALTSGFRARNDPS